MARVISTLPNHSTLVNGVSFKEDRGQMISEEVSDAVAANFASIPGYTLVEPKKAKPAKPVAEAPEGAGADAPANPPAAEGEPPTE